MKTRNLTNSYLNGIIQSTNFSRKVPASSDNNAMHRSRVLRGFWWSVFAGICFANYNPRFARNLTRVPRLGDRGRSAIGLHVALGSRLACPVALGSRPGCTWPMIGCTWPMIGCTWPMIGCTWPMFGCAWSMFGCARPVPGFARIVARLRSVRFLIAESSKLNAFMPAFSLPSRKWPFRKNRA